VSGCLVSEIVKLGWCCFGDGMKPDMTWNGVSWRWEKPTETYRLVLCVMECVGGLELKSRSFSKVTMNLLVDREMMETFVSSASG
jgi:hypothetical protein